jgi:hypothetical protein
VRLRHRNHHRSTEFLLHASDNGGAANNATRDALAANADKIEGAHARLAQLDVPTGQVVRSSRIVSHANSFLDSSEKHSLGLVLPERRTSGLHLRRLQRCRLERLYQLLNRAGSPCRLTHNGITIR